VKLLDYFTDDSLKKGSIRKLKTNYILLKAGYVKV
jgi:hypothetical protein